MQEHALDCESRNGFGCDCGKNGLSAIIGYNGDEPIYKQPLQVGVDMAEQVPDKTVNVFHQKVKAHLTEEQNAQMRVIYTENKELIMAVYGAIYWEAYHEGVKARNPASTSSVEISREDVEAYNKVFQTGK